MATDTPQRRYSAPCPGCGAPVEFRHAQSTHAVCAYCRSTVVRDGETLRRIGKMAEVFDDHSPLQLLARGRWQGQGQDFTLVGRLQYRASTGNWTEWEALLADGRIATLGEDNGSYVMSLPMALRQTAPASLKQPVGTIVDVEGQTFSVASNDQAVLLSAEGELPKLPPLNKAFDMVELRSAEGEVLSVDYGHQPPLVARGQAVRLDDLQLTGLRGEVAREEQGRQFDCPHCGAPVQVALSSTKTITCSHCSAVIDLSAGPGGELQHALQRESLQPLIALGSIGHLEGVDWQVVGFQHRLGRDPEEPDESFGWSEYLLYNAKRGFAFLVDSEDGWSMVKPTTGAPRLAGHGRSAAYLGSRYNLRETYEAETDYVAGEFYWPVHKGQKTRNRDFTKDRALLSMEQTDTEITWSSGSQIDSETVAQAFKLEGNKAMLERSDAKPTSAVMEVPGGGIILTLAGIVALVLIAMLMRTCNGCNPSVDIFNQYSRTNGGAHGGYSTGGGHK